jgi:hypothetical protein
VNIEIELEIERRNTMEFANGHCSNAYIVLYPIAYVLIGLTR